MIQNAYYAHILFMRKGEKQMKNEREMSNALSMAKTLEDLKKSKKISNTEGRPVSWLTDELWQKEFSIRRIFIDPAKDKKLSGRRSGVRSNDALEAVFGKTSWQNYNQFINDVIAQIRKGAHDYCFYLYQVMELERFFPGTLQTRFCDGYCEVWVTSTECSRHVA